MSWYKTAQQILPITIVSYNNLDELGISFSGGKTYIYPNVSPFYHNKIQTLLRVKNYREVQKILKSLSANRPDTENERKQMLNQLYDEGHLQ